MSPRYRAWLAILSGVVALSTLSARGACATLSWEAPSECPDADDAQRRLAEALGMPLAEAPPTIIEVELTESHQQPGYVASVRMRATVDTPTEPRTLQADTCSAAADAAVVVISLALSSPDRDETRPEAPVRPPPPTTPADDDAVQGDELAPSQPLGAPLRWNVEMGAVGDQGSLPGLAPGVELGFKLSSGGRALRVTGLAIPERGTTIEGSAGGSFSLLAASVSGCGGPALEALEILACAGLEGGRMGGQGTGVSHPRQGGASWLAPRVDLTAFAGGSGLRGFVRAGAVLPLLRPTFILGDQAVHQADSLAFRLGVGAELGFD